MITVVGAAGYTGGLLLRLLARHPQVHTSDIVAVSESHAGQSVETVHHDLVGKGLRFSSSLVPDADVVFLCRGHGVSREWMQTHDVGRAVVVDLSADHRLDESWVYGLPELNAASIATSTRIANPGCFATAIELALLPLAEAGLLTTSVVHATTGSTGAGQAPSETTHYSWRSSNLSVYKPFTHQHMAEITRVLHHAPTLVPLRGSFTRGILASCVVPTTLNMHDVHDLYTQRYADHPFATVVDELPDVKRCVGTNHCMIGMHVHDGMLLIVSVLDNLLKGASGQAVQNMNLACGWNQMDGLDLIGVAQ